MIDLRSDTITQPTAAMRQAMATAEVGDDVLGDDPTVAELERRTAEVLGKEAAVFMPSGTMTNQVAVRAHTEPGDEILLEARAHVYLFEAGAPAALSGVSCRLIDGARGMFTAEDVRNAVRPRDVHQPVSKLLCVENTHNRGGGAVWPIEA
ncbi:MAG: aminotransferase class I/II-fold pyridoxal phosphate-dependent enzyme, partial [Phycisphaerae bacterium]|nr:aminotransferase class I/II-fold pyridoxal phosphate-dependent enzyme [Phycisphaerae bacterium]